MIAILALAAGLIFSDGFESGDLSAWSAPPVVCSPCWYRIETLTGALQVQSGRPAQTERPTGEHLLVVLGSPPRVLAETAAGSCQRPLTSGGPLPCAPNLAVTWRAERWPDAVEVDAGLFPALADWLPCWRSP